MSAESKILDKTCPESFGGEIWGLSFAATHSVLVLTYAELDLKNTKPVGVDVVFWEIISNSGTFGSK